MKEVYVTEAHPFYHVYVGDDIVCVLHKREGYPLTWSEMDDIAAGFDEWFNREDN